MFDFKRITIYEYLILVLLIQFFVRSYQIGFEKTFPHLLLAVGTAMLVDFLIKYFKLKQKIFPKTGLISGLFIGLILDYNQTFVYWYIPVIASAAAMIFKNLIRVGNKNLFNPATSGLMFVSLIGLVISNFPAYQVWWVADFTKMINFFVLIPLGLFIIYKFKRIYLTATFLLVYFGLEILRTLYLGQQIVIGLLLDSVVLFFSFFMLTEPKTSPTSRNGRIVYGALVAVFAIFFTFVQPAFSLLLGLLVGNVFTYFINKKF